MAFTRLSDVYATIHKWLREDPEIRRLMGFDDTTTMVEMAKRIQKRRIVSTDVDPSLFPLISFYKLPGFREPKNHLSYVTIFDFDVYTQNDVETAIEIADRISELMDNEFLPLEKGSSLRSSYVTSAEDTTQLKDVYKYYTQISINLVLEG